MAGLLPGLGTEGEEAPEDDREDDCPVDAAAPPERLAGAREIAFLKTVEADCGENRTDDPPHGIEAEQRESGQDSRSRKQNASNLRGDVVEAPTLQLCDATPRRTCTN